MKDKSGWEKNIQKKKISTSLNLPREICQTESKFVVLLPPRGMLSFTHPTNVASVHFSDGLS